MSSNAGERGFEAAHSELLEARLTTSRVDPAKNGTTALWIAAYNGRREIAALLAERGARADAPSAAGLTPADAARSRGHDAIASALTAVCEKQKYTESVERRNPTKKYAAL